MFKIGEFSKITQVSVRMLRYYDEQGLLAPVVISDDNGYRYYSASQIEELNRIVLLRDMGLGVKDIARLIRNWSPDAVKAELEQQLVRTEAGIRAEQKKLGQIRGYLEDIARGESMQDSKSDIVDFQIVMKQLPSQYVISMRQTVADYYREAGMWKEFSNALSAAGLKDCTGQQSYSIYHDMDYREEDVDIEICLVADRLPGRIVDKAATGESGLIYRQTSGVDMAACFMVYGPYGNIAASYRRFAYWLETHPEYKMSGENRQICHVAGCDTTDPEEYVTELQVPLEIIHFPIDPHIM